MSLNVRNITDEDPSYFNGNQGGFMGGACGGMTTTRPTRWDVSSLSEFARTSE